MPFIRSKVMIHIYIYLFLFSIFCSCQASAGETRLAGRFKGMEKVEHHRFTLRGVDTTYVIQPDAGSAFEVVVKGAEPFYMLEGSLLMRDRANRQITSPLYLKAGETLTVEIDLATVPIALATADADNAALQEFRSFSERKMQDFLFDKIPDWNTIESWVDTYRSEARELVASRKIGKPVMEFLDSWRQVEDKKMMDAVRFQFPDNDSFCLPRRFREEKPDLPAFLDRPYWTLFPNSDMYIMFYLQDLGKEPEEQLAALNRLFTTPSLRQDISGKIVDQYMKRTPYSPENLARLEGLTTGMADRADRLETFRKKEFTAPGAAVPDVEFKDVDGRVHRLSEFKGKYVYVDIWASWCIPCCQEVPHLQKLEKDFGGGNVVFVSISTDKNEKSWKARMQQLGVDVHGHQWIVTGDRFSELMNIKSIPHFLMYDKEGRLMKYRARRPSSAMLRNELQLLQNR